jgi:glycosyltransferase involved in cell wall biosynthesis
VDQLGLGKHVHFVGSVPDEDLPLFYAASELYVLPSLHEGFGIPSLEAMACGVPVIVAPTGALPEVVGDAALVLDDPMDAAGLCVAIERLLHDESFRQEMIKRGFERAAAFSWKRSARRMLEVYHTVLEGHNL